MSTTLSEVVVAEVLTVGEKKREAGVQRGNGLVWRVEALGPRTWAACTPIQMVCSKAKFEGP